MTGATLYLNQALFAAIAFFAILTAMLPMGLPADSVPMPDLVFAVAFAWTIRSPSTAPFGLIAGVALLADILLMRPIGLWALCLLLATEFARMYRWQIREQLLVVEWGIFAVAFALALSLHSIVLGMAFSPRPGFYLALTYFWSTVIAYPVVVLILHWVFGVRSPKVAASSARLGRLS